MPSENKIRDDILSYREMCDAIGGQTGREVGIAVNVGKGDAKQSPNTFYVGSSVVE
jgi:hypothetical protein